MTRMKKITRMRKGGEAEESRKGGRSRSKKKIKL